ARVSSGEESRCEEAHHQRRYHADAGELRGPRDQLRSSAGFARGPARAERLGLRRGALCRPGRQRGHVPLAVGPGPVAGAAAKFRAHGAAQGAGGRPAGGGAIPGGQREAHRARRKWQRAKRDAG
ncbi:unnamed protein product, partial [Effrenium voratum]